MQCDGSPHEVIICSTKAHSSFISIIFAALIPPGVSVFRNLKSGNALPECRWRFFHKYLWFTFNIDWNLLKNDMASPQIPIAHIALATANSIQVIYGVFLCVKWFMLIVSPIWTKFVVSSLFLSPNRISDHLFLFSFNSTKLTSSKVSRKSLLTV